ncbi:MAG TPA: pyridoxamine 5'-phosphate oxidase family protein [Anaerolineales bacterium]|nr:pyridoxamine 5'-phosphate oxidase family protein [Anaerolineales bacterium]
MQLDDNNQFTPQASRPDMPEYGLLDADQGRGLLPWHWAQERLEKSHNYWVATTRPDGRPHATAVWGIWWNNTFYFSSGRLTRKARNLAHNSSCVVCIENAAEAVIVEGVAQLVSDSIVLKQLAPVYQAKYNSEYPNDSNVYAVQPKVVFGFIEEVEEFSGSATRWKFKSGYGV